MVVEAPLTRPSLLVRLRDKADQAAWQLFAELYAPSVYEFARRQRLQDADAADVTQEVLRAVMGSIKRLEYDPERGSFRGWLFAVTRHKLADFAKRRYRQEQGSGDSTVQELLEKYPAPNGLATSLDQAQAVWEEECERRLFEWAAERVRLDVTESTWQAFWLTAVEGRNAKEVAVALDLTVGAVYIAKSRVLARLREEVQGVEHD
jgi:RNA polymerase sigma-70 factor (ECF subfamily)